MTDPTSIIAAIGTLAFIINKIVERLRSIYPIIDGGYANLAAIVVSSILVGLWQTGGSSFIDPVDLTWFDYVVAVFGSAFGAGWLADIAGRSGQ